ncbi:hypothetical protein ACQZV8_12875 [Magnetococcales bacterium HHB-1]
MAIRGILQKLLLVCLGVTFLTGEVYAEADALEVRLTRGLQPDLRWENIEEGPEWVSGNKPKWHYQQDQHLITLNPGEHVTIRLPAWEWVRLLPIKKETEEQREEKIQTTDVQLFLSNGSGLYVEQNWQLLAKEQSFLGRSESDQPQLARLERPETRRGSITFALFISKRIFPETPDLYRETVTLPLPKTWMIREKPPYRHAYHMLNHGERVEFNIQGPARIRVDSRLRYPPTEQSLRGFYRITAHLNDAPLARTDHFPTLDTAPIYAENDQKRPLGVLQKTYWDIPKGKHKLRFTATSPLYIRLMARFDSDFLFPKLNARYWEGRKDGWESHAVKLAKTWINDQEADWVKDQSIDRLALLERAAWEAARNNNHPEGAFFGMGKLRAEQDPLRRPYLKKVAQTIRGNLTFFRHLLPQQGVGGDERSFFYYHAPRLLKAGEINLPVRLTKQHRKRALASLSSGLFTPLYEEHVLQYALPKRSSPTWIRVAVDMGEAIYNKPIKFFLALDDYQPITLVAHPDPWPELHREAYKNSLADAGLNLVRNAPQRHQKTLSGDFAALRYPAPKTRIAYIEIPLAKDMRKIQIWRPRCASRIKVALQIRVAKPFHLSEAEYLAQVERLPHDRALYGLFLSALPETFSPVHAAYEAVAGIYDNRQEAHLHLRDMRKKGVLAHLRIELTKDQRYLVIAGPWLGKQATELGRRRLITAGFDVGPAIDHNPARSYGLITSGAPGREIKKALVNHWHGLLNWLTYNTWRFSTGVQNPITLLSSLAPEEKKISAEERLKRAKKAEQATPKQWLVALENWRRLVAAGDKKLRRQAWRGMNRALEKLNENFLQERLLQGLYLYAEDAQIAEWAMKTLKKFYLGQRDARKLLIFLTHQQMTAPRPTGFAQMARLLESQGSDRLALDLGRVIPEKYRPWPVVTQAAHRLGWSVTRNRHAARLTQSNKNFWRGMAAITQRNYYKALEWWNKAGHLGRNFYNTLQEALVLQDHLLHRPRTLQLLARWSAWQKNHPGPRRWQAEPHLITEHHSAVGVISVATGKHAWFYQATPQKPVQLSFAGPVRLKLSMRPVHVKKNTDLWLNGWIRIIHNGQERRIPVTENQESPEVRLETQWQSNAHSTEEDSHYHPGAKVSVEYDFPTGKHDITVQSDDFSLLVRAWAERPAWPLGVLPQITRHTLQSHGFDSPNILQQWARGEVNPDIDRSSKSLHHAESKPLSKSTLNDQERDVIQRMVALVQIAEMDPQQLRDAVVEGEALFQKYPQIPGMHKLRQRLLRQSKWKPIATVEQSAGVSWKNLGGWSPESPSKRARIALLPALNPKERLVWGNNQLTLVMRQKNRRTLGVAMEMADLAFAEPLPMTVLARLNNGQVDKLKLTPDKKQQLWHSKINSGDHTVRFSLEEPKAGRFLKVRLLDESGKAVSWKSNRDNERLYYVATPKEPVRVNIQGPAWIRVDEYKEEGDVWVRYLKLKAGWQSVELSPAPGKNRAFFRIHERTPKTTPHKSSSPRLPPDPPLPDKKIVTPFNWKRKNILTLKDDYDLGDQEDGTFSYGAKAVVRRYGSEGSGTDGKEKFIQWDLSHRYFEEDIPRYWHSGSFLRLRDYGGLVWGGFSEFRQPAESRLFNYWFKGEFFLQEPDQESWEGAFTLRGGMNRLIRWDAKTYHLPALTGFARYLTSDDGSGFRKGYLDSDVYSSYKRDHRWGLSLSETLSHRPWLDTFWLGRAAVSLNENLTPDNLSFKAEWRQLFGDLWLDARYTYKRYLEDSDRRNSSTRHGPQLDLGWELWSDDQDRFELNFSLARENRSGDVTGMLSLTWHDGDGRGLRDFSSKDIRFLDLRRLRTPGRVNNRLGENRDRVWHQEPLHTLDNEGRILW